jgi:site-specific recombinase XerD
MTTIDTPWDQWLTDYAAYAVAVLGLAAATIRNHDIYLRAFATWWTTQRPDENAAAATTADLAAFLVNEAQRGLAARTRRSQAAALRRFYAWLILTGEATINPATALGTPRAAPSAPEIYAADEVAAILEHTEQLGDLRGRQRHAIVATLRYTGMRSGELRNLRTDQLDLRAGRARVLGKASRSRVVLVPEPLAAILSAFLTEVRDHLPASPLLLANAHPHVTTPLAGFGQEALAREVELAGVGAGVAGRHHPHKWRHTYATGLVRAGVDIHVVQRLLGHASIASTVGYTHLSLDDLQATVADVWNGGEPEGRR